MWIVELLSPMNEDSPWKSTHFPRRFQYKADAENLVAQVEQYGGQAKARKLSKGKPAPIELPDSLMGAVALLLAHKLRR